MIKIWIISKYASSLEEGFESRIFAFARRFARLGHIVSVISSDSNLFGTYPHYDKTYNFNLNDNVEVLRIKTAKFKRSASIKRIYSWIDFERKLYFAPLSKLQSPDVIIVSSLSLLTILNGIMFSRRYKAKLVFEIRDIWPLTLVEEGGFKSWNPFVKLLSYVEKMGYRKADLVVGTMPNLKAHVEYVTKRRDIKCECIPFGFDARFFNDIDLDPKSFRENFNIPEGKFIVGYAGSIGLTNALDPFIECSKMMADDDRFFFLVLGDGALSESYISRTSGQKNIIFIPKVARTEVSSFLALCDLLYFSALNSKIWDYGWSPNKLIDYMMAAKPVLASYSGHRSMLNEAGSGFFIPSMDAVAIQSKLHEIITMPSAELQHMGQLGRFWLIDNRNWDKLAQDYIRLLSDLVKEN